MSSSALKAVATGQQAESSTGTPYDRFKLQIERAKAEFLPLLGNSTANVDAFIRVVLNACTANQDLLQADRRSMLVSCMKAAQDGLVPDGREAVLNIYSTKVKTAHGEEWIKKVEYLPMVGGLIKSLYATGEVTSVDAAAVYANDRFLFRRGDDPKLEHEPTMADDAGNVVAAYVVVKLKSGEIKREVMPRRDIEAVRSISKAKDAANGPWVKWYDQQAIKSVIKRAYKQLPKNERFERVADSDNDVIGFASAPGTVGDLTARASDTASAALPHDQADGLDFGAGQDQRETVEVGGGQVGDYDAKAESAAAPVAQAQAPTTRSKRAAAPAQQRTYAQFAEAVQKAKDRDAAALVLDEARSLPSDQYDELVAAFDRAWPKA
jgi:recombination protein RecT